MKKAIEPGGFFDRYIRGRQLSEEEKRDLHDGVTALLEGGRFGNCGGQKQGLNFLDFFVSTAHAASYHMECQIYKADGTSVHLGIKTYEECQDAIKAYLNSLSREDQLELARSAGLESKVDTNHQDIAARAIVLRMWLRDALETVDGSSRGDLIRKYYEGYVEGTVLEEQQRSELYRIWNDPDLSSLDAKFAEMERIGIDPNAIIAAAALGSIPGIKIKGAGKNGGGAAKNKSSNGAENVANNPKLNAQLTSQEIANGHAFEKHVIQKGEFNSLGIKTREQYRQHVEKVLNNPTDVRYYSDGRVVYLDSQTRTVVIRNPSKGESTSFRPDYNIGWDKYIKLLPRQKTLPIK